MGGSSEMGGFLEELLIFEEFLVESKTRTYHGRVGSGRAAGRRGGAGQDGTPTGLFAQDTTVPRTLYRASKTRILNVFPEARTSEVLCKPTCRIQNPDTPRAGRVGRRTAGRLGGAGPAGWDADRFVRAGHNCLSCLPGHRRQLF